MATSAVSSSTSTATTVSNGATAAKATTAANRANAQKIISSLGAGSGVDVNSLAQNLVDAERIPRENALNDKITKNESRVSGYAAITFMMTELNKAVTALKDKNSFNTLTTSVGNANMVSLSTTASAQPGTHDLSVTQLAQAQRTVISGNFDATTQLNAGGAFKVGISVGGGATEYIDIAAGKDTPVDIAMAINDAKKGVTARLVNTGSNPPFKMVLTGAMWASKNFTISTDPANLMTADPTMGQPAQDAQFTVDGIPFTRSSNTVSDVITGVSLDLRATGATTSIRLTQDNTALKDKLNAVVTAYNDASNILDEVSNPKSTLETYGATLVGDSTVRYVKQQLRNMMLSTSSTPGAKVSALWQMGISIDETGKMSADATKLDKALTDNFDDVVQALTGGQNALPATSSVSAGLFGDAFKKITSLVKQTPDAALYAQTQNANTQNTRYKDDLTKLQTRMDSLLARYTKQFAAMESLVGQINSQKTSLKSSFDGMMAAYTKN